MQGKYESKSNINFLNNIVEIFNKDKIFLEKGINKVPLLKLALPPKCEGCLISCLSYMDLIFPASVGTVDNDYYNEISIVLFAKKKVLIKSNTLIAKIAVRPVQMLQGATQGSCGQDLQSIDSFTVKKNKSTSFIINTSIDGHIRSRSSLGLNGLRIWPQWKDGFLKATSLMKNMSFVSGQRIAQIVQPTGEVTKEVINTIAKKVGKLFEIKLNYVKDQKYNYFFIIDQCDFDIINPFIFNDDLVYSTTWNERKILCTVIKEKKFNIFWEKSQIQSSRGGFGSTGI